MSTKTNGRPEANGTAGEQVGKSNTRLPRTWHEQADWENSVSYAEGYAAGYAAAEKAIADEITTALGTRPMEPKQVIRWLIAGVGIASRERAA